MGKIDDRGGKIREHSPQPDIAIDIASKVAETVPSGV